jgi:putative ATP-dependent endonuclease of OLD family
MRRDDYPHHCGSPDPEELDEPSARELANAVLKARKGDGYAALFISLAKSADELPPIVRDVLIELDSALRAPEVPEADPHAI